MVSNDDVGLVRSLEWDELSPVWTEFDASETTAEHVATVPANEIWVLKSISALRFESGGIGFALEDLSANSIYLKTTPDDVGLEYSSPTPVFLPAGWGVRIQYLTGLAGYFASSILYSKIEV